jgi:hypothetical protein
LHRQDFLHPLLQRVFKALAMVVGKQLDLAGLNNHGTRPEVVGQTTNASSI